MWTLIRNSHPHAHNRFVVFLALCSLSLVPIEAAADPRSDYLLHCAGCHLENGRGSPPDIPDMRETLGFLSKFAEGRSYLVRVPGAAQAPISDAALAEVMNWMLTNYPLKEEGGALYTEEEVTANRHIPLYDPEALRKTLLKSL